MPALLALNDIVEVAWYSRTGTQNFVNVRHYRVSTVIGATVTDSAAVVLLGGLAAPLYKAWMNTVTQFVGTKLQVIRPTRKPFVSTGTGTGFGALVTDTLPSQVAAVVKLSSAVTGRSFRGRLYFGGFVEGDNNPVGELGVAAIAAIQAWIDALLVPIAVVVGLGSVDLVPIIYSRELTSGVDLQTTTIRSTWGTMRKRSASGRGDTFPAL